MLYVTINKQILKKKMRINLDFARNANAIQIDKKSNFYNLQLFRSTTNKRFLV